MAAITDFQAWLECADLESYEEVYSLYRSVADCSDYGLFNTQIANGKDNGWIVTASYLDDTLHLCSEKAKDTFLSMIEKRYCGDMTMEGWYAYKREMEKED